MIRLTSFIRIMPNQNSLQLIKIDRLEMENVRLCVKYKKTFLRIQSFLWPLHPVQSGKYKHVNKKGGGMVAS